MNANELIEAIRDTGAITIEMKKRIIPATLLVAGALFMACQPVAWGATSSSSSKAITATVKQDFLKCTPSWVYGLPRDEQKWLEHEIFNTNGVYRLLAPHIAFSTDIARSELSIQRERHWLKANYGQHGYESHKMALAIAENALDTLKKQERDDPRSSLCGYLPHMFRMLNYRYQHHDYRSAAERKAYAQALLERRDAEAKAKLKAEAKAAKEKAAAKDKQMIGMLINTIKTQVSEHWVPVTDAALACKIQIRLGPQGQLLGTPVVIQSSGNAHFNHLAIAALEASAPFVPPIGLPYSAFDTPIDLKMNAEDLNHG